MSTIKNKVKKCKDMIALSNTDYAIKLILEIKDSIDEVYKNDAIILSNQWNSLSKERLRGLIGQEDFELQRIGINKNILLYVDMVEKYLEENVPNHLIKAKTQYEAEKKVFEEIQALRNNTGASAFGLSNYFLKLNRKILDIDTSECSPEFIREIMELNNVLIDLYDRFRRIDINNWNPLTLLSGYIDGLLNMKLYNSEERIEKHINQMRIMIKRKSNTLDAEK